MADLRNWAEGGPEALAISTTGTGLNLVSLSTPGSASQEHQRREEARTKRRADEEESSSSSSEEEEESPISLDSDEEECGDSDTPSDPGRPEMPPYRINRPVTGRLPKRSPLGPSARKVSRKSRAVVVIRRTKGGEVRPA